MTEPIVVQVPSLIEVPGKPLGRQRLLNWRDVARHMPVEEGVEIKSVAHAPNVAAPLDQGSLGACTGFATGGGASTAPYRNRPTNAQCVDLYKRAPPLGPLPGPLPPVGPRERGGARHDRGVRGRVLLWLRHDRRPHGGPPGASDAPHHPGTRLVQHVRRHGRRWAPPPDLNVLAPWWARDQGR